MLPSLNSQRLRVYLSPQQLTVARIAGWWRRRVLEKHVIATGGDGWDAGVRTLDEWLGNNPGEPLEVVLSAHFARLFTLPWDKSLSTDSTRQAMARGMFNHLFAPAKADDYSFQLDTPRFGQAQCVLAVERELVAVLTRVAASHKIELIALTPLTALVWNRFQSRLGKGDGTLLIVEGDRVLNIEHGRGHIASLHLRPFFAGDLNNARAANAGRLAIFAPQQLTSTVGDTNTLVLRSGPGFSSVADPEHAYGLCGIY